MEQVKDIVFPGDIIAKEEEYLSGKNTQDIDGDVISTAFGKVSRDDKSLIISVDTSRQPVIIKRYDIVYGKIIKILNKEAVILISGVVKGNAIVPANTEARLKLPIPNQIAPAYCTFALQYTKIGVKYCGIKRACAYNFCPYKVSKSNNKEI